MWTQTHNQPCRHETDHLALLLSYAQVLMSGHVGSRDGDVVCFVRLLVLELIHREISRKLFMRLLLQNNLNMCLESHEPLCVKILKRIITGWIPMELQLA